jgi:2-keto-3-deoxy-6-phosphogluconate aldolase
MGKRLIVADDADLVSKALAAAGQTKAAALPFEQVLRGGAYLKAITAPYVGVEFIPTGGINLTNLSQYLAFKRVVACGGSWMAPTEWIATKQFDRIRTETALATALVRGEGPFKSGGAA